MKQQPSSRRKRSSTKSVLRLPDLELAKAGGFEQPHSTGAKRGYRQPSMSSLTAIARNRARLSTGSWSCVIALILSPSTRPRNHQSASWRRAPPRVRSSRLWSSKRSFGGWHSRVKGEKKLGMRLGNWLTAEQGHAPCALASTERSRWEPYA
jgi:hypothetical protein